MGGCSDKGCIMYQVLSWERGNHYNVQKAKIKN